MADENVLWVCGSGQCWLSPAQHKLGRINMYLIVSFSGST